MERSANVAAAAIVQGGHAERRLAVLIDGDNAEPKLIDQILAETARHGRITVRRIYGDWTGPQMAQWKKRLHDHAVQPVQQFRYTTGKNATDMSLIIDAMDLLHTGNLGGFCIASSDSDFTRLATRIREQGLFVMGIGRKTTPKAFVNACEVFVQTENLAAEAKASKAAKALPAEDPWIATVTKAIESAEGDDGWANLSDVGSYISQLDPAFDPRTFKHKKLSTLVKSRPERFQTKGPDKANPQILVRLKE